MFKAMINYKKKLKLIEFFINKKTNNVTKYDL